MASDPKEIFNASSKNVLGLLSENGLGLYIPPYQRPYNWDEDKIEKLLEDILNGYCTLIHDVDSYTFLGSIITIHDTNYTLVEPVVRTEVPAKVLTIIDGQQRLTSLLLFAVALHNQLRLLHHKMVKKQGDQVSSAERWLDEQSKQKIFELQQCFQEHKVQNPKLPYPRMIRAIDDKWSYNQNQVAYHSPIGHFLHEYAKVSSSDSPVQHEPLARANVRHENTLIDRYKQIAKALKTIGDPKRSRKVFEELPSLATISKNAKFQQALMNHDFPAEVIAVIQKEDRDPWFDSLLQLVLLSAYVLHRVALTVILGKNEDYAFSIFESLNTTGEPLTAYETFVPRVNRAEGLENYMHSESHSLLDEISAYLAGFKEGVEYQDATRDLLIYFAAAETGKRLSKRLADQRSYLKQEFERHEVDPAARIAFVKQLRNTAVFAQHSWPNKKKEPSVGHLPQSALTDEVKLCLSFLADLKHTVTIAPIVRFYSYALERQGGAEDQEAVQKFQAAIKAFTAFSALWRASRRNTGGIDDEYRDILTGNGALTGYARLARTPDVKAAPLGEAALVQTPFDVVALKTELRARLSHAEHGGLVNRAQFIADARRLPLYKIGAHLTRFILLAAHNNAAPDAQNPGLLKAGKAGFAECLTYTYYRDENAASIEHIAPQDRGLWVDSDIYSERETVDQIGNLALLHQKPNSALSNRLWKHKRILYSALAAPSADQAEELLAAAPEEFAHSTKEITSKADYQPQLAALASFEGDWNADAVGKRSDRLLGLAWDSLYAWLL
jgi:hypothetical protein